MDSDVSVSQSEDSSKSSSYFKVQIQPDVAYLVSKSGDKAKLLLDTQGKYLLTAQKLQSVSVSIIILAVGMMAVVALIVGYILVKKKYWFW